MSSPNRWSVNGVRRHTGREECDHAGCQKQAQYVIELVDDHANHDVSHACEDHGEPMFGYDPEEVLD